MAGRHADSVHDKHEFRGQWWLPNETSRKVDGILEGSEVDGFTLNLFANFRESTNPQPIPGPADLGSTDTINGQTFSGRITVFGALQTQNRMASGGLRDIKYVCQWIVKGAWFATFTDLRFLSLRGCSSVLCDWMNAKVFNLGLDTLPNLKVEFSFPEKQLLYDGPRFSVSLAFGVFPAELSRGQNAFNVEWEPHFLIETKSDEIRWMEDEDSDMFSILYTLNYFLSVATLLPCYPFHVVGHTDQFVTSVPGEAKKFWEPIELMWEQEVHRHRYDERQILFPWRDIASNPTLYFSNWFTKYSRLKGPIALFADSLAHGSSYSAERFLGIAMALEVMHRFAFLDASIPSEDHNKKLDAINDAAPAEYKKWLKEKLQYSHEPSLRRRLKDLVKPFQSTFDWLIGDPQGSSSTRESRRQLVIGAIVESRNALAHALPEPGREPGQRYLYFTKLGQFLMAMWLMKEIGFKDSEISKRFVNNYFVSQDKIQLTAFLQNELRIDPPSPKRSP